MKKYKYANPEHTAVNDLEKGNYNIRPGVWMWKEVEEWVAQGNTIEDFETPTEALTKAKAEKEKEIAKEKQQAEDNGVTIDGVRYDVDSKALVMYLFIYIACKDNPSFTITNFKASEGTYITMNATVINKIYAAIVPFYSSIITKYKEDKTKIADATTVTQVAAI
jgi:hypothetical protein